jgi:hypothetical protein
MKNTFRRKYLNLKQEVVSEITSLIRQQGEDSKHRNERILKVNEAQQFNLDGGRYLEEVASTELIDNQGYAYHFDVLTLDQLCEIVDSFF